MEMEGQFIWEASNMSRNLPGLRILKQMQMAIVLNGYCERPCRSHI